MIDSFRNQILSDVRGIHVSTKKKEKEENYQEIGVSRTKKYYVKPFQLMFFSQLFSEDANQWNFITREMEHIVEKKNIV